MKTVARSRSAESAEARAGLAVLLALAIPAVVFTGQFPPLFNPNELSRLVSVSVFVETGSFQIDDAVRRFHLVEDLSRSDGHLYSNKAPGLTLAAVPVYRVLRVFFLRPERADATIFYLLRLIVVTPICLIAVWRFLVWVRSRMTPASTLVGAAVALGTPFLFYSRSFFSHAWTASLLFLALDRIRVAEISSSRRRVGVLLWAAGFLAGWAAISEYPVTLLAGLLLLRAGARRRWSHAGFFALGLVLPFLVLLGYNTVCFGSPFILSSARESLPEYAQLAGKGLFGFSFPSLSVAFQYLFHPARGLILFSPFWIWSVAGFVKWRRRGDERADWIYCLAAVVLFFVAMTAYPNWHGGWSLGNRYLLPILFPAGLALGYALESPASRFGFATAAVFSVAVHELLSISWPHYPADLLWPARNGSLWFLSHGWAARGVFGDGAAWMPIAALVGLVSAALALIPSLASAELRGRAVWAFGAGVGLFAASLAVSPSLDFYARLWRAEIFGRASGRDPNFEQLRAELPSAATPAEIHRANQYRKRYRLLP